MKILATLQNFVIPEKSLFPAVRQGNVILSGIPFGMASVTTKRDSGSIFFRLAAQAEEKIVRNDGVS